MSDELECYTLSNVKDIVARKHKALIAKLREGMSSLSTRKPMSEYDDGYNACLDDCLSMLNMMEE